MMDRRQFLGWVATGAAGLLVPGIVRPKAKVFDMGRGGGPIRPPECWDFVCHGYLELSADGKSYTISGHGYLELSADGKSYTIYETPIRPEYPAWFVGPPPAATVRRRRSP